MKRFYKEVTVGDGNTVLLDGRVVRTPGGATLAAPTRALAEVIAEEWRAQGDTITPAAMPLTKLANTAIDRIPPQREAVIAELTGYGGADLLAYRADEPELVARQAAQWDPLLDWANETLNAHLSVTSGVTHVPQPEATMLAFAQALTALDDWTLAAMQPLTTITGSLVLAFAVQRREKSASEAFALSRLDEDYQAERWGLDSEAEKRAKMLLNEMALAERFLELVQ